MYLLRKWAFIILIITLSLLTSCSGLLDYSYTRVKIYTAQPTAIIHNQDTIQTVRNKARLRVKRSKEPLKFSSISQDFITHHEVQAKKDLEYHHILLITAGIGHLILKKLSNNHKPLGYTYPDAIFINPDNQLSKRDYFNRRAIYFQVSLPIVNSFYFQPRDEEVKINTGLFGFQTGFDFYSAKNTFINVGFMYVGDATIGRGNEFESMTAASLQLSNNHRIKSLSIGYGFVTAAHTWRSRFLDNVSQELVTDEKSHAAVGFILPIYYQLGKSLHVGLIYKPTFYPGPRSSQIGTYEHTISFELAWKIRLR